MPISQTQVFDETVLEDFSGAPFFLGTPFSDKDRALVRSYSDMVPKLSSLLGRHCEILVHSLEDPAHCIVAAANTSISGRKVGDPARREGIQNLLSKMEEKDAYFCRGQNAQHLKVALFPILNAEGRCLGSFTIAMNLDAPISEVVQAMSPEAQGGEEMRIFGIGPIRLDEVIAKTCAEVEASGVSVRNRSKCIISELQEKGVFNYRGSVELVSRYTSISPVTVYWHLREMKKKKSA